MSSNENHTKAGSEREAPNIDESPPTYEQSTGIRATNAPIRSSILDTIQRRRQQLAQREGAEGKVILNDFVSQDVVPYLADALSECDEVKLVLIPAEGTPWQQFSKREIGEKKAETENAPIVSLLSAPSETISSCIFMTGVLGRRPFWIQPENLDFLRQEIMTAFAPSSEENMIDEKEASPMKEPPSLPARPLKPKRRLWGQRGSSPKLRAIQRDVNSQTTSADGSSLVQIGKDEVSLRWTTDFGLYETHVSDAVTVKLTLSDMAEDLNTV